MWHVLLWSVTMCCIQFFFCFFRKWQTLKNNICIKLLFQIGKIGAETFQMLTFAFKEEAVRQTVVFDCSAESRNGMTSVKDAEYSGCLLTGRMYRNVEHIYRIWHESRCITIHKLANELGSLMVYTIKFWHHIEFVIDVSKFLPCILIYEQKQFEWHQFIPGHWEEMSAIHTSFQRSLQMTTLDLPAWSRQRHLFLCEMLTDVSFDEHGIMCHDIVP